MKTNAKYQTKGNQNLFSVLIILFLVSGLIIFNRSGREITYSDGYVSATGTIPATLSAWAVERNSTYKNIMVDVKPEQFTITFDNCLAEKEYLLSLEDWMLDDMLWSVDELKIGYALLESWMLNMDLWVPEYTLFHGDDYAEMQPWMLDTLAWTTSDAELDYIAEDGQDIDGWMLSSEPWTNGFSDNTEDYLIASIIPVM